MKRFIVLVIDSYGIGAMDDIENRPEDKNAHTYRHIFESCPWLSLPTLEKLGLGNIADPEAQFLKHISNTSYGSSLLQHWGADTFLGHQEILGTTPLPPVIQPFSYELEKIESILLRSGYRVRRYGQDLSILIVNESAVIGDNLETDLGQNYNVTASFDQMSYKDTTQLGRLVRQHVFCNRVIAFGAPGVTLEEILNAYQEKDCRYAGVSAPLSGVYKEGYRVLHLGYGINHLEQVPFLLGEQGIPSILIGKVADVAENHPVGVSYGELVDTDTIFDHAVASIQQYTQGFFCINIQETDLAGHSEDPERYAKILSTVDLRLNDILDLLNDEDILIVTADHGNDPTIGHSKHTREKVPILLYGKKLSSKLIGERESLSDIGASACDFFDSKTYPPNGISFL